MINGNATHWFIVMLLISLLITFVGFFTSRKLPEKRVKIHRRKFAAVGLALVAFAIPVFNPFVIPYSGTESLDNLKAENLTSTESLAKFETEQSRQIERLKEEVKKLRDDLYAVNSYYSALIQVFSTAMAVLALSLAFQGRKEKDFEEKILKL